MLAATRRDLLLERLRTDGRLVAKDLALELRISEDSIRRDLRDLAAAGLCTRVYGGALPVSPATGDYATRSTVANESKRRVAAHASTLITAGSTVILDGGTTTLALTRAIPTRLECDIITHSPTIAAALLDHAASVYLIGGTLYKHSAVATGAAAAEMAQRVSADVFFLGVVGIHPQAGLTTGDPEEAAMKRLLASRAAETYVLGSGEKLGAAARHTVLPLDEVTAVIADPADGTDLSELAERTQVIRVP
jgi:DeoR/GlpR family transcriptional regulator of sugar metabolism